ncbi:P-loop containing nucleoside triphosphate hydrolase protein [Camillea tinctor]|nr:P-loop containing nucleoside triphosphate hydrolase protein [Camillea tinctor]
MPESVASGSDDGVASHCEDDLRDDTNPGNGAIDTETPGVTPGSPQVDDLQVNVSDENHKVKSEPRDDSETLDLLSEAHSPSPPSSHRLSNHGSENTTNREQDEPSDHERENTMDGDQDRQSDHESENITDREQDGQSDNKSENTTDGEQDRQSEPHNPFEDPYFKDRGSSSRYSRSADNDVLPPIYKSIKIIPKLEHSKSSSGSREATTASAEWKRQDREPGESNIYLDQLMAMEGRGEAKSEFLKIKAIITAAQERKGWLRRQVLNLVLLGNPGTGKRTISALYRGFLRHYCVWQDLAHDVFYCYETTGFDLQGYNDIKTLESTIEVSQSKGLVLLIIIHAIEYVPRYIRAQLMYVLERHARYIVVVLTGSIDGTTTFLESKPSGKWLFPRRLVLKDYDDEELHRILLGLIDHNSLTIDGGDDCPYALIAAKRVGKGRDSAFFGNVHDIVSSFEKMLDRQALRLQKEQFEGLGKDMNHDEHPSAKKDDGNKQPSQSILTMEDIIGPKPIDIRTQCTAWKELEKMVGLEDVKKAVRDLFVRAKANYRREIRGQDPLKTTLNRVFLGPPGTGKTTVAKIYGQILADIGVLTSHDVVVKTPADFIGRYTGESETKTSQILNSTLGKVLIIDDAHMFYNGSMAGATSEFDGFRLGCIDVLVSAIHNKPDEDRCVILIGYPDRMEVMFQHVNPGLRRRFPLEEAFRFENYDDVSLNKILRLKMAEEDIKANQPAMDVAAEVLRRARDRPNFGNGGDVDNLLTQAKIRFRNRKLRELKERKRENLGGDNNAMIHEEGHEPAQEESVNRAAEDEDLLDVDDGDTEVILEREDFDPEWSRGAGASQKCQALFKGLIGFESIIDIFQGFQRTAMNMRLHHQDPRDSIPFTYIFKGPPGTGKTHTARIVGQIFYDMGFLSTNEVMECSASHLIGQYIGHTAPKVLNLFRSALGKVLFIDEAYRLGGGGVRGVLNRSYDNEAVGELVDCMTKPEFHKKMIVVLAGYDKDMDALMKVNAGLQGRFPTEISFPPMSAIRSRQHLYQLIREKHIEVLDDEPVTNDMKERVLRLFDKLSMTSGWANGRDIQTLAATITERVYRKADEILEEAAEAQQKMADPEGDRAEDKSKEAGQHKWRISTKDVIEFLKDLLRQRIKRGRVA